MVIPRRELEVPDELARRGLQGNDRIGVEVVAVAHGGIVVGLGIADAPEKQIRLGVIGAGHPGGSPALLPGVPRPTVVMRIARLGDGVEGPAQLSGGGIVRVQQAVSLLEAGADHDQIAHGQWRRTDPVPVLLLHTRLPQRLAGVCRQGNQARIPGTEEQAVAQQRDTPVYRRADILDSRRRSRGVVCPDALPGARIHRYYLTRRESEEHDAVSNHR